MVMECQGFPKNKKDPCLLSVSAAAPECGPVLCFSLCPLSLLFSIASWPLAILTLFWIPECARLRPAWRLSAFRSPVIGVFFSAPSRCLAHSYISAQISLQQTFLSMYNAPYALLDAWGYISEEIRQRPNFCGSTFCLFLWKVAFVIKWRNILPLSLYFCIKPSHPDFLSILASSVWRGKVKILHSLLLLLPL